MVVDTLRAAAQQWIKLLSDSMAEHFDRVVKGTEPLINQINQEFASLQERRADESRRRLSRASTLSIGGAFVVTVAIFLLNSYLGDRAFSRWMSLPEFNATMKTFDSDASEKPVGLGHGEWVTALEGRWHAGIPQYRVGHSLAPDVQYLWHWAVNLDRHAFNVSMFDYATQGFVLVYFNKFQGPDGAPKYQAVWRKFPKQQRRDTTDESQRPAPNQQSSLPKGETTNPNTASPNPAQTAPSRRQETAAPHLTP